MLRESVTGCASDAVLAVLLPKKSLSIQVQIDHQSGQGDSPVLHASGTGRRTHLPIASGLPGSESHETSSPAAYRYRSVLAKM